MSLEYRKAKASDMSFVVSAFLDSYRTAHAAGLISMEDWDDVMSKQWDKVLTRDGVEVFVACHPTEKDTRVDLYGFIVVDRLYDTRTGERLPMVIYVDVKYRYRKLGVARGLFNAVGVDPEAPFHYACKTGVVTKLRNKIPLAKWHPLPIRFPRKTNDETKDPC